MPKILTNKRTLYMGISLMILFSIGIGWYLESRRPPAEPIKIYKAVQPLKPKAQAPNTREAPSTEPVPDEAPGVQPSVSDMENRDADFNPTESDMPNNTEPIGDTAVSEENTAHEQTLSPEEQAASQEEQAASQEPSAEEIEQMMGEASEMLRESMSMFADMLNSMSTEEQIKILRQIKTGLLDQISQGTIEPQEVDDAWQMFLDWLSEAGYTPPGEF